MQTRQERESKVLSGSQFLRKLSEYYRQYLRASHWDRDYDPDVTVDNCIVGKLYGVTVVGLDFAKLPKNICQLEGMQFNSVTFKSAKNVDGRMQCEACVFDGCEFLENADIDYFNDCIIFTSEDWLISSLNGHMSGSVAINRANRQPLVAMVYAPSHGVGFCEEMVTILKSQGLQILKLQGSYFNFDENYQPDHPITRYLRYVDGIYLPGGMDVVTDESLYTFREKLEHYLVEQALKCKIPTIAVCRGHQFIGHYFGATVKDVPEKDVQDFHEDSQIDILDANTHLYRLAAKIARRHAVIRGPLATTLQRDAEGLYYEGYCAHDQGVYFANNVLPPRVKATAMSADGLLEGMEVGGHILTFQHHHEAKHDEDGFSRAVIRHYVSMVKQYHDFKESRALTRSQAVLFGRKRSRDVVQPSPEGVSKARRFVRGPQCGVAIPGS